MRRRSRVKKEKERRLFQDLKEARTLENERLSKVGGSLDVRGTTKFSHTGHIGSSDVSQSKGGF